MNYEPYTFTTSEDILAPYTVVVFNENYMEFLNFHDAKLADKAVEQFTGLNNISVRLIRNYEVNND